MGIGPGPTPGIITQFAVLPFSNLARAADGVPDNDILVTPLLRFTSDQGLRQAAGNAAVVQGAFQVVPRADNKINGIVAAGTYDNLPPSLTSADGKYTLVVGTGDQTANPGAGTVANVAANPGRQFMLISNASNIVVGRIAQKITYTVGGGANEVVYADLPIYGGADAAGENANTAVLVTAGDVDTGILGYGYANGTPDSAVTNSVAGFNGVPAGANIVGQEISLMNDEADEVLTDLTTAGGANGSANPLVVWVDENGQLDVAYKPLAGAGATPIAEATPRATEQYGGYNYPQATTNADQTNADAVGAQVFYQTTDPTVVDLDLSAVDFDDDGGGDAQLYSPQFPGAIFLGTSTIEQFRPTAIGFSRQDAANRVPRSGLRFGFNTQFPDANLGPPPYIDMEQVVTNVDGTVPDAGIEAGSFHAMIANSQPFADGARGNRLFTASSFTVDDAGGNPTTTTYFGTYYVGDIQRAAFLNETISYIDGADPTQPAYFRVDNLESGAIDLTLFPRRF